MGKTDRSEPGGRGNDREDVGNGCFGETFGWGVVAWGVDQCYQWGWGFGWEDGGGREYVILLIFFHIYLINIKTFIITVW